MIRAEIRVSIIQISCHPIIQAYSLIVLSCFSRSQNDYAKFSRNAEIESLRNPHKVFRGVLNRKLSSKLQRGGPRVVNTSLVRHEY